MTKNSAKTGERYFDFLESLYHSCICPVCGEQFYIEIPHEYVYKIGHTRKNSGHYNYTYYCSWTCFRKAQIKDDSEKKRGQRYYECDECGKTFWLVPARHPYYKNIYSDGKRKKLYYCSLECSTNTKNKRKDNRKTRSENGD